METGNGLEINALAQEVEVKRFDRFLNLKNGAYYAYVEVPVAMLAIETPEGTKGGQVETFPAEMDAEGNVVAEAQYRQKTMAEFMMPAAHSLDGTMCIAPLCWMERPTMRTLKVTRDDLIEWETFVTPRGLPVESWLTLDERNARINSSDYRDLVNNPLPIVEDVVASEKEEPELEDWANIIL